MSVEATTWAWQQDITAGAKLVLLALADHAGHTGYCYPGSEGLASKCGITLSTVWKHIQTLEKAGLIERQKRATHSGRQSNAYQLAMLTAEVRLATLQRPKNRPLRNVRNSDDSVSVATSEFRTGTVSSEPSYSPPSNEGGEAHMPTEEIVQDQLTEGTWPDWYALAYSRHGFTWPLEKALAWLEKNGISYEGPNSQAERAAEYIRTRTKKTADWNSTFRTSCRKHKEWDEERAARMSSNGRSAQWNQGTRDEQEARYKAQAEKEGQRL